MKVLALTSYPVESAGTRFRLMQFVEPLARRGISLEVLPFIDSRTFATLYDRTKILNTMCGLVKGVAKRLADMWQTKDADVIFVQREAMLFGPPLFEWLAMRRNRCPLVLDLDDATFVRYTSPTYGRLANFVKYWRKTDDLIRWAHAVVCGNRHVANYAEAKGARTVFVPTVVDTEVFRPRAANSDSSSSSSETSERAYPSSVPVVGWIGTHSTYPYLESIFPALEHLAREYDFRLKIVGSGKTEIKVPGVTVETLAWSKERELADFQSFDVGLYPLVECAYSLGKSGFKAIQYMAVGVPFVSSPIGANAEIGVVGQTHLCATTEDEWFTALEFLLVDSQLRKRIGSAGRAHALARYTLESQADKLARVFADAMQSSARSSATTRRWFVS